MFEPGGRRQRYYPYLFRKRRVVEGIREEPELFLDCFCTNKLFDVEFLRRNALRFPEDIHYEDHVFGAEMYAVAQRFAVVPWVVYHWHRAPATGSISLSIKEMDNVRHRMEAARRSDAILREHGCDDLQGFLFARPLPADAATALLVESARGKGRPGGRPSDRDVAGAPGGDDQAIVTSSHM